MRVDVSFDFNFKLDFTPTYPLPPLPSLPPEHPADPARFECVPNIPSACSKQCISKQQKPRSPKVFRFSEDYEAPSARRQEQAHCDAFEIFIIGGERARSHIYWSCLLTGSGSDHFVFYLKAIQLLVQSKLASTPTDPTHLFLFLFRYSERPATPADINELAVSNSPSTIPS